MSFLNRIEECNEWAPGEFLRFEVADEALGMVRRDFAADLAALSTRHQIPARLTLEATRLHWCDAPLDFAERTVAMAEVCERLIELGRISHKHGEPYPVTSGRREDARFLIDRACAPYFGVRAFGQHLNGFVRRADGLFMWIARRAPDRRVFPNRLDNMVAGGLPWGLSFKENLIKECAEEAGMAAELAADARPVGAITYCRASKRGLKPDVMYCYDLELPEDFEPSCTDGEVAGFELLPVEAVADIVQKSQEFKLNCNLVIIDFLVRHGLISPEHPDYLEIIQRLRSLDRAH